MRKVRCFFIFLKGKKKKKKCSQLIPSEQKFGNEEEGEIFGGFGFI